MKLLKIKMSNLNSLRGNHELDFTKPPLAQQGLFLITGETGAGKTTILDAITLALYGKTPRAQNWTSGSEKEMLSYGESECLAEVEFETDSGTYRCSWQFGLTRTGNPKTPKRLIAELKPSQSILATKHSEVDEKVTEVLKGLDYNRFIRSVLLAQGDFTEFLKGEEERSLILERVTNTSIYSEIGYAAYHRLNKEKEALKLLDIKLEDLKYLSDEERDVVKQERADLQATRDGLEAKLKKDEVAFQWLADLEKLQAEAEELSKQRQEAEAALRVLEPKKKRLEQHQKAVAFRNDFKQQAMEKQQLQNLEKTIADLEKAVAQGATKLKDLSEQKAAQYTAKLAFEEKEKGQQQLLQKARKVQTQWEGEAKALERLQVQYNGLQSRSEQAQEATKKLESQRKQLIEEKLASSKWLEKQANYAPLVEQDWLADYQNLQLQWLQASKQLKKLQVRKQQLQTQTKAKQQALEESQKALQVSITVEKTATQAFEELSQDEDPQTAGIARFSELRKRRETAAERGLRLEELADKIQQRDEQTAALGKINASFTNVEIQLHNAEEQMDKVVFVIDQVKDDLEGLKAEERQLDLQMNLSERREQLEEGEACPLCGSETHPFREREKGFLPKTYKLLQEEKEKVQSKIDKERAHYQATQVKHRKLEQEYSSLTKERKRQEEQLQDVEAEIDALVKLLGHQPIFEDLSLLKDTIAEQKLRQKEEGQRIEALERHWNQLEQSRVAQAQAQQQLQSSQIRINELKAELKALQSESSEEEKQRRNRETALSTQLQLLQRELSDFSEKSLEALRKELQEIQKAYKLQQKQLQDSTQQEALLAQEYEQRQAQLKETSNALAVLQKELNGQEQKTQALKEEQDALLKGKSIELIEEELSKERKQILQQLNDLEQLVQKKALEQERSKSQLELKKQQFAEEKEALKKALTELEAAVKAVGFADTEAARLAILEEAEAKAMAEEQQRQQRLLQKLQDQDENLSEKQKALKAEAVTEEAQDELAERIDATKQKQEELLRNEGELNNRLDEDAKNRRRAQDLIEKREKQHQVSKRWQRLYDLIGKSPNSRGRHKFRDFAQGITLDELLRYTNRHLTVFFDNRYELRRNSDTSLEIDIVDKFQADFCRRLSTLSGGETFLVSLSLALGLSDLASRQADLRSLFVDEGFGSLDADTLNVAMTALHALEAKGKNIGLISHVEQLKDRIATQVQVRKKGSGFSTVKVIEA